jgi:hypothetical protein
VDESNRPQPHGCGGRLAQWQALPAMIAIRSLRPNS